MPLNLFCDIRAALFDLDGTLVETHIDFPLMKREVLSIVRGFGVRVEELRALDILTVVEEGRRRLIQSGRAGEGERLRKQAFARLEEIEVEQCRNPVEIPGATQLTRRLRERGIKVGIVTRNCRSVSLDLLRFGNLAYDALVTRDDVPITKPDPAHLTVALIQVGLDAQHLNTETGERLNAVMIGDHWMDVQAGRAAGLCTVGILHGRTREFFEPAVPDLFVERTADLLPLLP